MLYIHKLSDLNQRTADTESVYLIREMKQKLAFPFSAVKIQEFLEDYNLSESDLTAMENSLQLIEPTLLKIETLLKENDPLYESTNLQRSIQILTGVPAYLSKNLIYGKERFLEQKKFIEEFTSLLNAIPRLQTQEEKIAANEKISKMFEILLRNQEFCFKFTDVIHEGHVSNVGGLRESMIKGYLFHFTLEEELNKTDFSRVKLRIPPDKRQEVEQIEEDIATIYHGVKRAYELNKRMVDLAVMLYSLVKMVHTR